MDFFEVIEKRKTVRKFLKKEVPLADIEKMIDCARLAPSAMNQQPWDFVVIRNLEKKRKIRELYEAGRLSKNLYKQDASFVENATLILVCSNVSKMGHVVSTSLAIENLVLSATALGYGCVIMTSAVSTEEQKAFFRKECNISNEFELIALIAIGYPAYSDFVPKPKRALNEVMHLEKF